MPELTNADRDNLIAFEGYGPPDPLIVFIGQEERLDNKENPVEEIIIRSNLIEKHGVRGDKQVWHQSPEPMKPGAVAVWKYASLITAEIAKYDPNIPELPVEVQRGERWVGEYARLGTWGGFTLLTERLPFPLPSGARFKESWLTQLFKSHKEMFSFVEQTRLKMLRTIINSPSVRYVFMYGAPFNKLYPSIVGFVPNWEQIELKHAPAYFKHSKGKALVRTQFYGGMSWTPLEPDEIPALVESIAKESRLI